MKNRYEVRGDVTAIFIEKKNGMTLECLIDTEDLPKVLSTGTSWKADWHDDVQGYYVSTAVTVSLNKRKTVMLHRLILDAPKELQVDHISHDPLDNRKQNLRLVTPAQNQQNKRIGKSNTSGALCVYWHSGKQRWRAYCNSGPRYVHIGWFKEKQDAATAAEQWRAENLPYSVEARKGDVV